MADKVKLTKAQVAVMLRMKVLLARDERRDWEQRFWMPANCDDLQATPVTVRKLAEIGLVEHVNPGVQFEGVSFRTIAKFAITPAGLAYLAEHGNG